MNSKVSVSAVLLLSMLATHNIFAQTINDSEQRIARRIPHDPQRILDAGIPRSATGIVIKFHDGSGIRARDGLFELNWSLIKPERFDRFGIRADEVVMYLDKVNALLKEYKYVPAPLFDDREESLAYHQATAERYWRHETAELATYAHVANVSKDLTTAANVVRTLVSSPIVEIAYIDPVPEPLVPFETATWIGIGENPIHACYGASPPPDLPDFSPLQGYLWEPPAGINVMHPEVRNQPGGRGQGVRIFDIEFGYDTSGDHPWVNWYAGKNSTAPNARPHGQSNVSVLASLENGAGTVGIAPNAYIGFRSVTVSLNPLQYENAAPHIYWAGKHSHQGVVLIELHRDDGPKIAAGAPGCECNLGAQPCDYLPVEWWPAEFDAIKAAVGNGVTVVEPAGNGSFDLDALGGQFIPGDPALDSGAIFVSGSMSDGVTPICKTRRPNVGSRVNAHSWAENVPAAAAPTGGVNTLYNEGDSCWLYRNDYAGTSSASAIIAGAAALVIAQHEAIKGFRPDPLAVRQLLEENGTPQVFPVGQENRRIGVHPDLKKIFELIQQ